MESVYALIYEPELFYAAQEPPPCRLSKEDLSKPHFKNTFKKPRPKRIINDTSPILTPLSKKALKTTFQNHFSEEEPKRIKGGGLG